MKPKKPKPKPKEQQPIEKHFVIPNLLLGPYDEPLSDELLSNPEELFSAYRRLREIRRRCQSSIDMGKLVAVNSFDKSAPYNEALSSTIANLDDLDANSPVDSIPVSDYLEMYKDSGELPASLVSSLKSINQAELSNLYIFSDGEKLHLIDKAGTIIYSSFDIALIIAEALKIDKEPIPDELSEFFVNLDALTKSFRSYINSPEESDNHRNKGSETIHRLSKLIYSLKTAGGEYLSTSYIKQLLLPVLKKSFSGQDVQRNNLIESEFEDIFASTMNELNSHLLTEVVLSKQFSVRQGSVGEDRGGGDTIITDHNGDEVYLDWKSNIVADHKKEDGPIVKDKVALVCKNKQGLTYKLDLIIMVCHRTNWDVGGPKDKYKLTVQLRNGVKDILFDELVDWQRLLNSQDSPSISMETKLEQRMLKLLKEAKFLYRVSQLQSRRLDIL